PACKRALLPACTPFHPILPPPEDQRTYPPVHRPPSTVHRPPPTIHHPRPMPVTRDAALPAPATLEEPGLRRGLPAPDMVPALPPAPAPPPRPPSPRPSPPSHSRPPSRRPRGTPHRPGAGPRARPRRPRHGSRPHGPAAARLLHRRPHDAGVPAQRPHPQP